MNKYAALCRCAYQIIIITIRSRLLSYSFTVASVDSIHYIFSGMDPIQTCGESVRHRWGVTLAQERDCIFGGVGENIMYEEYFIH